jgi:hypothetical protein
MQKQQNLVQAVINSLAAIARANTCKQSGSDDKSESHMIYVTINDAFDHKELSAKCPLDLNVCEGIFLGSAPYRLSKLH